MTFVNQQARKLIWATGLALISIFVMLGSPSSQERVDGTEKYEKLLAYYLDGAFAQTDKLIKFQFSPELEFVCEEPHCGRVAELVSYSLPQKAKVELPTEPTDGADVSMSMSQSGFEDQSSKIRSTHPDWHESDSGDARCRARRWLDKVVVRKLLIVADPKEGVHLNVYCYLTELIIGSGARTDLRYDDFSSFSKDQLIENAAAFKASTISILNIHWSVAVSPGATRLEAEEVLRAMLNFRQ